jgi:hypothetical protein
MTGTIDYYGNPCMSDEELFRLMRKALKHGRSTGAAKPKKRAVLLHKAMAPDDAMIAGAAKASGAAATKPGGFTSTEMLKRLNTAVTLGKVTGHDAVVAEKLIRLGTELPAPLRKLLEGIKA